MCVCPLPPPRGDRAIPRSRDHSILRTEALPEFIEISIVPIVGTPSDGVGEQRRMYNEGWVIGNRAAMAVSACSLLTYSAMPRRRDVS
jgi:hypothetical protein